MFINVLSSWGENLYPPLEFRWKMKTGFEVDRELLKRIIRTQILPNLQRELRGRYGLNELLLSRGVSFTIFEKKGFFGKNVIIDITFALEGRYLLPERRVQEIRKPHLRVCCSSSYAEIVNPSLEAFAESKDLQFEYRNESP